MAGFWVQAYVRLTLCSFVPAIPTMTSVMPSSSRSTAFAPSWLATTRSMPVGVPPRWMWPSTETLMSSPGMWSLSRLDDLVGAPGALGDHHDGVHLAAPEALDGQLSRVLVVPRDLRDQDEVGAAGDAGRQRELSRGPPHHLDDEDALQGGRRVADAHDGVEHGVERGVEADREVAAADVVVDGRGDADDLDAALHELVPAGQRAIAADDDEALHVETLQRLEGALLAVRRLELGAAGRPQEGAAAVHDAAHGAVVELACSCRP